MHDRHMIVGVWHRVKSQNQPAGSLELKVPGQNSSEQFDHIMSQTRPQLPVLSFHRFCIKMMEQTWKEVCTYSDALQQQQQQKKHYFCKSNSTFLSFLNISPRPQKRTYFTKNKDSLNSNWAAKMNIRICKICVKEKKNQRNNKRSILSGHFLLIFLFIWFFCLFGTKQVKVAYILLEESTAFI